MINPKYLIGQNLKMRFEIDPESHNIIHANSIISTIPIYTDFGIETRYNYKILKEMATIYASLIKKDKLKYHIKFSAIFYKINEEDQRSDEIEIFINLNINHNLAESDMNNIYVKSQLEHQIRIQETKKSRWIFDKKIQ